MSLLASATEIVCALGAGEMLVGRSHECDNPAAVKTLPQCSEPSFDIHVSSREIDAEVNRRLRAGEPLYHLDTELIRSLAPELIIAQSHCEVCAVTPGDVDRSGALIEGASVLPLSASSLDDIFRSIADVAQAIGRQAEGRALIARERERLAALRRATSALRKPTVVLLEWTDPIFPMGNWGPELVDAAGGNLVIGNRNQHSAAIASEDVLTADPEYVIVAPCGFDLPRTLQEQNVLERYAWWPRLRAVREGKVAFADGNRYFNRSGMTVVRSAEIIAEILHGLVTDSRTEGQDWVWMRSQQSEL